MSLLEDRMYFDFVPFMAVSVLFAGLFRLPFINFPMDEEFATHTYQFSFAKRGIKWKKDVFIHFAQWKYFLLGKVFGNEPDRGPLRIRLFFALAHMATTGVLGLTAFFLTGDKYAAFIAAMLYAFFGGVPALYAHSINFEQLYVPFVIGGFALLVSGNYQTAAILLGIASLARLTAVVYILAAFLGVTYLTDITIGYWFAVYSFAPLVLSLIIDFMRGYMNKTSLLGLYARFATGMQKARPSIKNGSFSEDLGYVFTRTAPVWMAGFPALLASLFSGQQMWILLFAGATAGLFFTQKHMGRNHYIPVIAMLCLASASSFDLLISINNFIGAATFTFLFVVTMVTASKQATFYLRPTALSTLTLYQKADQYILIPLVGRALGKLARIYGIRSRMFVWGSYAQLYHYAGIPASDQFIQYASGPWTSPGQSVYFDSLIGGLIKHRPVFIIKVFQNLDIDLLQQITGLQYILVKTAFARFPVYKFVEYKRLDKDPLSLVWEEKNNLLNKLTAHGKPMSGIDKTDHEAGFDRRAIKETKKLLRLCPDDMEARFYLASLYSSCDCHDEALTTYKHLAERAPDHPGLYLQITSTLMELGRLKEAEQMLPSLVDDGTDDYFFIQGRLFQHKREYRKAVDLYRMALTRDADSIRIKLFLGESLELCGKRSEARVILAEVWKNADPVIEEKRRALSAILLSKMTENISQEIARLSVFVSEDPNNDTLQYAFASRLETAGRKSEAEEKFRNLATSSSNDAITGGAWYRLARLSDNGNREVYLKNCLKRIPKHGDARRMLHDLKRAHVA